MFGFGKNEAVSEASPASTALKEKIEKHEAAFNTVLKEKNLAVKVARVCMVMDVSGSMQGEFRDGTVQSITERIMPLGLQFDDNGELEFYIFSNDFEELEAATMANIDGYVKHIVEPKAMWRGTSYAPVIQAITKRYGKKDPSKDPTFVVFITDGDNNDKPQATKAIIEAAKHNIFWKFVGVSSARMPYLEQLDDMEGRVVDNANFFQVKNINSMSDEELYTNLLKEYGDWIGKASMLGIL